MKGELETPKGVCGTVGVIPHGRRGNRDEVCAVEGATVRVKLDHQGDAAEAGFFSALISRYSVTPVMTNASSNGPRNTPSTP
jgi:hypothetical protein